MMYLSSIRSRLGIFLPGYSVLCSYSLFAGSVEFAPGLMLIVRLPVVETWRAGVLGGEGTFDGGLLEEGRETCRLL